MDELILTGSADLHLRLGAFGGLYAVLAASFPPATAFFLALTASFALSMM